MVGFATQGQFPTTLRRGLYGAGFFAYVAVLGGVLLRDVTVRRREQVLDVLNRVLRHNVHNRLDVAKARANLVAERTDSPELSKHLTVALSAMDSVLGPAAQARATRDQLDADSAERVTVAVSERVTELAAGVRADVAGELSVGGADTVVETDGTLFDPAVGSETRPHVRRKNLLHTVLRANYARMTASPSTGTIRTLQPTY